MKSFLKKDIIKLSLIGGEKMNIGRKIKFFRERLGYTQQQLGYMIHVSENAIGNYETGRRNPSIELLREIAVSLKVELNDFFVEEKKALLQFPMNYIEFREWGAKLTDIEEWNWFEGYKFEFHMKSDRYFVELKDKYLIWLKDGFYLVPIEAEWADGGNNLVVKIEDMRKVIKKDLPTIEKEIRRKLQDTYDINLFAEQVYVSKYDFANPVLDGDVDRRGLKWLAFDVNNIIAYNDKIKTFYIMDEKGIKKVPICEEWLGFLKEDELELPHGLYGKDEVYLNEEKINYLNDEELKGLKEFVIEEEYFVKRLFGLLEKEVSTEEEEQSFTFEKIEEKIHEIETRELLNEKDKDVIAHLLRYRIWSLDNLKRMFKKTTKEKDSIFDDVWDDEEELKIKLVKEKREENEQENETKPKDYRFLLVEDSPFMRVSIKYMLQSNFSCQIEEASDGKKAIEMYQKSIEKNKKYDLIIMDICLPNIDGIEALQEIRKMDDEAIVIMCSSLNSQHTVSKCVQKGAKHFISKPIEEEVAILTIGKVLNKKENQIKVKNPVKILNVDDAEFMRTILQGILETTINCEVYQADNGDEALQLYQRHIKAESPFELIILDFRIGEMDGIELLEKIRETNKEVPIIMSGTVMDNDKIEEAFKKGANHVIEKPFEDEKVVKKISQFMNENSIK